MLYKLWAIKRHSTGQWELLRYLRTNVTNYKLYKGRHSSAQYSYQKTMCYLLHKNVAPTFYYPSIIINYFIDKLINRLVIKKSDDSENADQREPRWDFKCLVLSDQHSKAKTMFMVYNIIRQSKAKHPHTGKAGITECWHFCLRNDLNNYQNSCLSIHQ